MNEKEAIERLNRFKTIKVLYGNTFSMHLEQLEQLQNDIKTALNLIQTQQAEIEKQSKEKNLIYDFLYKFGSKFSGSFMKALSEDGFDIKKCENCEYETCDCKDCIKQYFERKVENENWSWRLCEIWRLKNRKSNLPIKRIYRWTY